MVKRIANLNDFSKLQLETVPSTVKILQVDYSVEKLKDLFEYLELFEQKVSDQNTQIKENMFNSLDSNEIKRSLSKRFQNIELSKINFQDFKNEEFSKVSNDVFYIVVFEGISKLRKLQENDVQQNLTTQLNLKDVQNQTDVSNYAQEQNSSTQQRSTQDQDDITRKEDTQVPIIKVINTAEITVSPEFMTGLLIGGFIFLITLIGACCLFDIKSPEKFAKLPLIIGRES